MPLRCYTTVSRHGLRGINHAVAGTNAACLGRGEGATRPGIVTMATCGRGCARSQRFANDQSLTIVTRPDPVWSKSVIERGG